MSPTLAPAGPASTSDPASRRRPGARRHTYTDRGRHIAAAFSALSTLPALGESCRRIEQLAGERTVAISELARAIEAEPAMVLALMLAANGGLPTAERHDTVRTAVEHLGVEAVADLARTRRSFDFFEQAGAWRLAPHHLRLHGLATQRATEAIVAELFHPAGERLTLSALLHDVGKLVLMRAYPGYPAEILRGTRLPEERLARERRELGIDHALVGAVVLRRGGLPAAVTDPIAHHHDADAEGEAAIIRLADMLAHYLEGGAVSPQAMLGCGAQLGISPDALRRMLRDLPGHTARVREASGPCPLSARELAILRRLSEGSVYKEIALELELSPSTVRSHLNKIYRKLGARDRAQAVLISARQGWLQ